MFKILFAALFFCIAISVGMSVLGGQSVTVKIPAAELEDGNVAFTVNIEVVKAVPVPPPTNPPVKPPVNSGSVKVISTSYPNKAYRITVGSAAPRTIHAFRFKTLAFTYPTSGIISVGAISGSKGSRTISVSKTPGGRAVSNMCRSSGYETTSVNFVTNKQPTLYGCALLKNTVYYANVTAKGHGSSAYTCGNAAAVPSKECGFIFVIK